MANNKILCKRSQHLISYLLGEKEMYFNLDSVFYSGILYQTYYFNEDLTQGGKRGIL